MQKSKLLVTLGIALSLFMAQGFSSAYAKGSDYLKNKSKQNLDKNKDGIPDSWELRYHLGLGKDVAKKDNDKDGLTNAVEYKLNLNPVSSDTNHNKISDGDEDFDKDGVPNLTEVEFNLNPANSDTDNDGVNDGKEKDKNGVTLSNQIKNLNIQIHTNTKHAKEIQIHFNYRPNGKSMLQVKDRSGLVTKDKASALVNEITAKPDITKDQIIELVKTDLNLTDAFKIKVELEYVSGKDKDVDKEVPSTPADGSTTDGSTTTSGSTTTDGTTSTEGTTPADGSTTTDGSTPTSGSTTTDGTTATEGSTPTNGSTTSEGSTSTSGAITTEA